jgi:maltooligosyltrehalose trehalohydrolase
MVKRRFPVGAEPQAGKSTHFRVWAPASRRVWVVERGVGSEQQAARHALEAEPDGYHSGLVRDLHTGDLYGFELEGSDTSYPDPASRFQPEGPHGPSEIVDAASFAWSDSSFTGEREKSHVVYELHVGTFSREGTYDGVREQLAELARVGITTLELMPLADFPGRFGWGYDGVDLWSPTRLYGRPDDLRRLVDEAHGVGMSVILDVVYNHLGPDGNYLKAFSPAYFTDRYENEWGEALNFDGAQSGPVREFFVQNARYWIEEFHFDGLRLDATQSIFDASEPHVIAEIIEAARAAGRALGKKIWIVAENEPQEARIVRAPAAGGYDCDALWNDDFQHSAKVALTGSREAYYTDYTGSPQELISACKWGYLYQGQHYVWQKKRRGTASLDLGPGRFVAYLDNHDQIANSATGERMHRLTSPQEFRAMTALLLLAPSTPMLFQGQEFGASTPFLYFADHEPDLAKLVDQGRRKFLQQFPSLAAPEVNRAVPDASDPTTFQRCKLDFQERETNRAIYALHLDLLALRRDDSAFGVARAHALDGAVLGERAFVLRFFSESGDRLLVVNLGADLELQPVPEPLLAPPERSDWNPIWSSEDPKYGGTGHGPVHSAGVWKLPARSAHVFGLLADPSR